MRVAIVTMKNIAHIHHVIPIAYELAKHSYIKVDIFADTAESENIIRQLGKHYSSPCNITQLMPGRIRRLGNWISSSPPRAKHILYNNRERFKQYHGIVSPDLYTDILFEEVDRTNTKFIFAFHGAGDGSYGYKREITNYDLLLLSNSSQKKRLLEKYDLPLRKLALCGYVKFDLVSTNRKIDPFNNGRLTVLYAPHFRRNETSWYDWGLDVLRFFYNSSRFNLIFAPHVMLGKKERVKNSIPPKYLLSDHMLFDFGSIKCIDMSHCLSADIFLGDASSQIYEFLYYPRPAIFLNNKQIAWQNRPDYAHWQAGDVITDLSQLEGSLVQSRKRHEVYYCERQKSMFATKFEYHDAQSGKRASTEIINFLRHNA